MKLTTHPVPVDERYFEDYPEGTVYDFPRAIVVTEAEMLDFARRFDPQYFHTDPARAAAGPFKGLIASGWHTMSLTTRLCVEQFLPGATGMGSPGVDEVRWLKPLRPGDAVRIRVTVTGARPSSSRPDRGYLSIVVETVNQNDEVIMTFKEVDIVRRRV